MDDDILVLGAVVLAAVLMISVGLIILLWRREPWPEDYLPELEAREQQRAVEQAAPVLVAATGVQVSESEILPDRGGFRPAPLPGLPDSVTGFRHMWAVVPSAARRSDRAILN